MMQLEQKIKRMDVHDEERHESIGVFRYILNTCRRISDSEFREIKVESLKEASRRRKDNFYKRLSKGTRTLTVHENCNLEYKSSDHITSSAYEGQWSSGAYQMHKLVTLCNAF